MAIRVAQYKGTSLVSRAIKFVTWGKYSHTAIMLDNDYIIEAWQGSNCVRVIGSLSEGHKPGTPVDIYSVRMGSDQERKFREFVEGQVGKKYDFWGIAGFLRRKDLQRGESWFCSELFAAGCEHAGVTLLNNVRPAQVSPSMVTRSPITTLVERRIA